MTYCHPPFCHWLLASCWGQMFHCFWPLLLYMSAILNLNENCPLYPFHVLIFQPLAFLILSTLTFIFQPLMLSVDSLYVGVFLRSILSSWCWLDSRCCRVALTVFFKLSALIFQLLVFLMLSTIGVRVFPVGLFMLSGWSWCWYLGSLDGTRIRTLASPGAILASLPLNCGGVPLYTVYTVGICVYTC